MFGPPLSIIQKLRARAAQTPQEPGSKAISSMTLRLRTGGSLPPTTSIKFPGTTLSPFAIAAATLPFTTPKPLKWRTSFSIGWASGRLDPPDSLKVVALRPQARRFLIPCILESTDKELNLFWRRALERKDMNFVKINDRNVGLEVFAKNTWLALVVGTAALAMPASAALNQPVYSNNGNDYADPTIVYNSANG